MEFFNSFQPTIVQLSDDVCIPKSLRSQYMICLNALGIKWFDENFISLEVEGLVEGESLGPSLLMLEDSGANKIDVPRIYIPITKSIVKNDSIISKFYIQALTNNLVYAEGIEDFRPGVDYYVNNTLYVWLTRKEDHDGNGMQAISEENDDIVLPDYLTYDRKTDKYSMSNYFVELTDLEKKTTDLKFFYNKNKILKLKFSEDELDNFPQTFFSIILEYTMIDEERRSLTPNNGYEAVMNYYKNFKSDQATILLQTIFNTDIVDETNNDEKPYGCNSCTNSTNSLFDDSDLYNKSCYEKYKDAMDAWLSSMLSNIDYYNDWYMMKEGDSKYSNYDMIDLLISLLNSIVEYNHYPESSSSKKYNCNCPSLDSLYDDNECNSNIVKNYILVLNWIKKCELVQNKNKIKVYGNDFANLLKKY